MKKFPIFKLLLLLISITFFLSCINSHTYQLSIKNTQIPPDAIILKNPETDIIIAYYYITFKKTKDCKNCKFYLTIQNYTSWCLQSIITDDTKEIKLKLIIKNPKNEKIKIFKKVNNYKKVKLYETSKSNVYTINFPTNYDSNKVNILIKNKGMLLSFIHTSYKIN